MTNRAKEIQVVEILIEPQYHIYWQIFYFKSLRGTDIRQQMERVIVERVKLQEEVGWKRENNHIIINW